MTNELEPWGPAIKRLGRQMAFWQGSRRHDETDPPIRLLRAVFLAFVLSQVGILVISAFTYAADGSYPKQWLALWVTSTVVAVIAMWFLRRKEQIRISQIDEPGAIIGGYRTLFFLLMAFAMAVGLVGFIITNAVDSMTPYLVAFPVSQVMMWTVAPTARSVAALQAMIDERGGTARVADALMARVGS